MGSGHSHCLGRKISMSLEGYWTFESDFESFYAPWLFQDSRSQCMARTETCSTQLLIGRYQTHISIASFRFGVLGWLDFLVSHPLLHLKRCNSSMIKHSLFLYGCCWDAQSHVLWRPAVLKACFIVFGGCKVKQEGEGRQFIFFDNQQKA